MATQVLEGTWEEITRHAKKFIGRKVRITVLEDEVALKPNNEMLEALRKVSERSKNMPFSSEISNDFNKSEWLKSVSENDGFDFLKDESEDIYTLADGKPLNNENF